MLEKKFYKYLYIAPLLLLAYMPFHVFISTWFSSLTGGLEFWRLWKDFLTVVVTLVFIAVVFLKKRYTKTYLWLIGLTALYGFIHLILLLANSRPSDIEVLSSAYNLRIFAYTIMGLSLALLLAKENLVRKYTKVLILVSTIVCFLAFLQWFLPKDILTHFGYEIERGVKPNFFIDDKPDLFRVFSTLRDPNSLGAFLILPIVFLSHKLVGSWKSEKRNFFLGLLILHVLILFLTFSRSTLLATVLAVSVFFVFQQRQILFKHRNKLLIVIVSLAVVLLGIFALTKDSYFTQNYVFHADESTVLADPNELRVQLFQETVEGIQQEPLGHGPGSAGLVSTRDPSGGLLTENYWLQILYEVGIIGFILFVSILGLILKKLWDKRRDPMAVVLLSSFVGLAFANLLFHTWANEAVAISWFLLAGIAMGAANHRVKAKTT